MTMNGSGPIQKFSFVFWPCLFLMLLLLLPKNLSAKTKSKYFCAKCHPTSTSPGIFPGMPNLAGQHPEYIVDQMKRFLDGSRNALDQRVNATMAHKAKLTKSSDWFDIATYFSEQECVTPGSANLAPPKNNRCSSCHGEKGLSTNPSVPNLAGQSIEYMIAQIREFKEPFSIVFGNTPKTTLNTQRSHPIMTSQSLSVSNEDLGILIYYASLPCRLQPQKD